VQVNERTLFRTVRCQMLKIINCCRWFRFFVLKDVLCEIESRCLYVLFYKSKVTRRFVEARLKSPSRLEKFHDDWKPTVHNTKCLVSSKVISSYSKLYFFTFYPAWNCHYKIIKYKLQGTFRKTYNVHFSIIVQNSM